MEEIGKKLVDVGVLIGFIIALGTAGYMGIEEWNFFDSLYMTIITLTTVGYREIHRLSYPGVIFTMILIVGGGGDVPLCSQCRCPANFRG